MPTLSELAEVGSEAELIAEAEIGDAARKFRDSELGQTILGMAKQETQAAQEELLDIDPSDLKKIMALQNQARLGHRFEGWLLELINRGEEALTIWRENNAG